MKELGDLELRMLPRSRLQALISAQENIRSQSLEIEHYECAHKPLPEYSNISSLSEVHHALGFLPDPTCREVLLEEIDSDEDDNSMIKATKVLHCIKVINGELVMFCNIKTRT